MHFVVLLLVLAQAPLRGSEINSSVATVNGEAILESEVEDALDAVSALFDRQEVTRQLVYQRLLDQKAKAAGVTIDDEKLTDVMRDRVTQAGGWDAYRKKLDARFKSVEQDRQEIRRALLADAYVDECVGLVAGSPLVRPDLARRLQVTPKEVQDFYRDNKDRFRTIDRRVFGRVQVAKGSGTSEQDALERIRRIRQSAIVDHHGSLKEAAQALEPNAPDLYSEQTVVTGNDSGLRPEIQEFLANNPLLIPSPLMETGKAFLCVVKLDEQFGRQRDFAEVQDGIQRAMLLARRDQARWALGAELLKGARIWPADLMPPFDPSASAPAPK